MRRLMKRSTGVRTDVRAGAFFRRHRICAYRVRVTFAVSHKGNAHGAAGTGVHGLGVVRTLYADR